MKTDAGRGTIAGMHNQEFDAAKAVAEYRRVIARREKETTLEGKSEFDGIAMRMRAAWKAWQGEESLHEMAFGDPE